MPITKETEQTLAAFAAERDWGRFHTPENLAKSISIEAAELLELYQWTADPEPHRVREELADVLTYCLALCRRIGADPDRLILEKLELTRKKYPVRYKDLGKAGSSKKNDDEPK